MADLRVDTELMRTTATEYGTIASEMLDIVDNLQNKVEIMRTTVWQGQGADSYYDLYRYVWADSVRKYSAALSELQGVLNAAANDYDEVKLKADALKLQQ